MKNEISLEVAISTLNEGLCSINFREDFNYIVIHQITNGDEYFDYVNDLPENVKYIFSHEVGLSISRNLAIENCTSDFLWIMDDDVNIHSRAYDYIKGMVKNNPDFSMYVVSHSDEDKLYLNDKGVVKLNKLTSTQISSIDMILDIRKIGSVRFDTQFGLGADYPSGEEYIFACDLLSNKLNILKSYFICTYHPKDSSGFDFYSTPIKLKAKRLMFNRCFGKIIGNFVFLLFIMKKFNIFIKNKSLINIYKSFK